MVRNFLVITIRHLLKNKLFSLINIGGLALGMAVCLIIFRYVSFESSFDQFHQHASDIYRVPFSAGPISLMDRHKIYASNVPAFGPIVREELPEVAAYARLLHVLTVKNTFAMTHQATANQVVSFYEDQGYYADASLLSVFSFPLVLGNPQTALEEPNGLVMSETLAKKYFGNDWQQEALGAQIAVDGWRPGTFTITGVLKDIPANSHLQFDFLLSYASLGQGGATNSWVWSQIYTYVQLAPNTNPQQVEAKLPALIEKHYTGGDHPEMFLQPLADIYLDSNLRYEAGATGSRLAITFLTIIGLFILLIAWVNYINLTTVRSLERAQEVGIRKVMGAQQRSLILQFIVEALLMNIVALIVAIVTVYSLLPIISEFLHWSLPKATLYELLRSPVLGIPFLFLISFLVGSVLSALYPAMVLSAFSPMTGLKGKLSSSKGSLLRQGLATFQFAVSMILIIGTFIVYQQIRYMQQKDLGMDISQVMALKAGPSITRAGQSQLKPSEYQNVSGLEVLTSQLQELAFVEEVSATSFIPGQEITRTRGLVRLDNPEVKGGNYFLMFTDEQFIPTLGLQLIAGRNFSDQRAGDTGAAIINEAALARLGYTDAREALQKKVRIAEKGGLVLEIVGVIENYHQKSLQQVHEPIILQRGVQPSYVAVRMSSLQNIGANLDKVHSVWQQVFPDQPYDYFFLDDYFAQQYQADRSFHRMLILFALVAVFIACVGLAVVASYNALQRRREIGIRKVLGASESSIAGLLTKHYGKLIGIALFVALPLGYYLADQWLSEFAFRVPLQVWMFIVPISLLLLIVLSAISYPSIKAAHTNPVDTLRYE